MSHTYNLHRRRHTRSNGVIAELEALLLYNCVQLLVLIHGLEQQHRHSKFNVTLTSAFSRSASGSVVIGVLIAGWSPLLGT